MVSIANSDNRTMDSIFVDGFYKAVSCFDLFNAAKRRLLYVPALLGLLTACLYLCDITGWPVALILFQFSLLILSRAYVHAGLTGRYGTFWQACRMPWPIFLVGATLSVILGVFVTLEQRMLFLSFETCVFYLFMFYHFVCALQLFDKEVMFTFKTRDVPDFSFFGSAFAFLVFAPFCRGPYHQIASVICGSLIVVSMMMQASLFGYLVADRRHNPNHDCLSKIHVLHMLVLPIFTIRAFLPATRSLFSLLGALFFLMIIFSFCIQEWSQQISAFLEGYLPFAAGILLLLKTKASHISLNYSFDFFRYVIPTIRNTRGIKLKYLLNKKILYFVVICFVTHCIVMHVFPFMGIWLSMVSIKSTDFDVYHLSETTFSAIFIPFLFRQVSLKPLRADAHQELHKSLFAGQAIAALIFCWIFYLHNQGCFSVYQDPEQWHWPIRLAEKIFFGMVVFVAMRICFEVMHRSHEFIHRFAR